MARIIPFIATIDLTLSSELKGDKDSQGNARNVRRFLYGFEPGGQVSWVDREADAGASGSALENGNGDAFAYAPDGSLTLAYRNVHYNGRSGPSGPYAKNNWPWQGNSQGDGQMNISSPDGLDATADTYGDGFGYDAAGNRTQVTVRNQALPAYQALGNNEYQGWTYGGNFNTQNAGTGWAFTYDAESHLTNATGPNGQGASFEYDGLGRLCAQSVNGTVTHFYYAGAQRVEERDGANRVTENYMFDAPGSDQILVRQGQYGQHWYQYDGLGNTSHLSDGAGTVVEQYLYDGYGAPSVYNARGTALAGSACDNRYLFKGAGAYQWVAPMALYYCRARFYLPQHGRWLQPDPIGQQGGLNLYTYCHNDPVNASDPSGLTDTDDSDLPKLADGGGTGGGSGIGEFGWGSGPIVDGSVPTGSHIPNHRYTDTNNGVYFGNNVFGSTYVGDLSFPEGGYKGVGYITKTDNGKTNIAVVIPGAGGGYNTPNWSNNDLRTRIANQAEAQGTQVEAIGRDNLEQAENELSTGSYNTISIVGYSRGAVAAVQLATALGEDYVTVDNLATIDPVTGPFDPKLVVPYNVSYAINFYQTNGGYRGAIPLPGVTLGRFAGGLVEGADNYLVSGKGVSHLSIPSIVAGSIVPLLIGP